MSWAPLLVGRGVRELGVSECALVGGGNIGSPDQSDPPIQEPGSLLGIAENVGNNHGFFIRLTLEKSGG